MAIRNSKRWSTACLTLATAFVLCGGPEFALAQQSPDTQQQPQQTSGAQNTTTQSGDTQNTPTTAQPTDQNNTQQNNAQQSSTPQNNSQPTDQQAPDAQNQQSQSEQAVQQQQQQTRPGIIDPSKGPLTPAPSTNQDEQQPTTEPQNLPDAPSSTQGAQPQTEIPAQKPRPRSTQPVGVGTAQQAPTAGGAASKPAGAAIAPAKQKQYRSLLIKIGAIAAGGAALGTVYALTRATKSTPPGAGR